MIRLVEVLSDTNIGGAGILLLNLLKNIDRSTFDVSVILPERARLRERIERLKFRVYEVRGSADRSFSVTAIGEYKKLFSKLRPDIVHTHSALSARVAAYLSGVPVRIHTRHCAFEPAPVLTHFPIREGVGALNSALSTHIIAVADAAADDLIKMGVPKRKITTIINGCEPLLEYTPSERCEIRRELGFDDNDFIVGINARLEKYKGHDCFLNMAKLCLDRSQSYRFMVIGEGSQRAELEKMAAKLGIADKVRFTGFVSDVATYMNILDVNVNCSRGTETSSLALSEGMSIGLPSVVSDFGGNPYMVRNGENGFSVETDNPRAFASTVDSIRRFPSLRQKLSEGARERYKNEFTAEKMTRETEMLYLRAIKEKSRL